MTPVKVPNRIDDAPHLLMWSADELVPMLLGLVAGVLIGQAFICLMAGVLVTNLYRRFCDNNPDGFLLHLLYWNGFIPTKAKSFKNPYARKYLP